MTGFSRPITVSVVAPRRSRSSSASLRRVFFSRVRAGFGEHFGAACGVVAAYVEGEEVESAVDVGDPRLVLVEGQAPRFQPGAQPRFDLFGLFAAVAQGHEVVGVGDDGRGAGFQAASRP